MDIRENSPLGMSMVPLTFKVTLMKYPFGTELLVQMRSQTILVQSLTPANRDWLDIGTLMKVAEIF